MSGIYEALLLKDLLSGSNTAKKDTGGLRKRDIKLVAELLGVELPIKRKQEEKAKEKRFTIIEAAVLLTIASWLFGPYLLWMQIVGMNHALNALH